MSQFRKNRRNEIKMEYKQVDMEEIERVDKRHVFYYAVAIMLSIILVFGAGLLLISVVAGSEIQSSEQQYYVDAYHFTPTEYLWLFLKSFVYKTPSGHRIRVPTYYDLLEAKLDNFPIQYQSENCFCAPAIIESLFKYYNSSNRTQEEIYYSQNGAMWSTSRCRGFDMGQITTEVDKGGLQHSGFIRNREVILEHLRVGHLVIVTWRPTPQKIHASVLLGIKSGNMYLADPELGRVVEHMKTFYDNYNGMSQGAIAVWKEQGRR